MANAPPTALDRLRLLEEALRFARVGLYRYRFDGTIIDMNEAAFDILDLEERFRSPADVIGRNIEDLIIYVGPRKRLRSLIRARGEARNVLYPFRTLAGVGKWVVHDSFPVADPATGEEVVQAIIKDVTEAHEREAALRASEERLVRVVETIADGITILDSNGRITFANAAAERILGLTRSAIAGRTYNDPAWRITTVDGRPVRDEDLPFQRVMHSGAPVYNLQHAIERPDGSRIILSINAAPLRDAEGGIVGVVASLSDITEQERLERLRDEFLSTAAHELKTPVATIKGYAQLLSQWAPGGHEPREGAAFAVINRQSDRLSRLVQELLEFSRLQYQRFQLHRQRTDLGALAAEAVGRLQATAPRHRLLLRRGEPVWVEADPDRIDEVLSNLLDNAIKVSPAGAEIETAVYVRNGDGVVSVTDHGPGIPPDRQAHIFERFYQAHAGTPYDYGGMGMGLYLSREIVTRHGGRIWFESEWGKGSTFYFSLPLAEGKVS